MTQKKQLAVLFGGPSPESAVSLSSASAVMQAVDREQYDLLPIGIDQAGQWYRYYGDLSHISDETWCEQSGMCHRIVWQLDRPGFLEYLPSAGQYVSVGVDIAFPVLHGCPGEDGTVQGLFSLSRVPVAGCGVLASALAMDKHRAHILAASGGIQVPRGFVATRTDSLSHLILRAEEIGYPLIVKPLRAGSSLGISYISSSGELPDALDAALVYDSEVIVERFIPGIEMGCAVMGNTKLICGVPDEIQISAPFFDNTEKYTLQHAAIHVPARVEKGVLERVQAQAQAVYKLLGCSGFARVDFFYTPEDEIFFSEVNTIPGFTAHSRFPRSMAAAGYSFAQVVSLALELARPLG